MACVRAEACLLTVSNRRQWEIDAMAWTTPKFEEVCCGMEINMYFAAKY